MWGFWDIVEEVAAFLSLAMFLACVFVAGALLLGA